MASLMSKLCSFLSNSINCNLTISAFDFLSFFIYLLSLFCYLYHYSFISYSFCNYLFSFCIYLFLFLFYMNLSARRICVHNCFLFLLYGGARSRDTTTSVFPYYSYSLSLNPPPLEWSVRRTLECEQTLNFCLIKVYCYLAGKFDNILFNWAIINFFLIEYYVRAYWIFYVEFVFQNKLTFSQFYGNDDVCPHFNNVNSLNPAADRWALHPCLTSRAIKISPRYV